LIHYNITCCLLILKVVGNSGQVVVQHGKNALQALKDAVTDILRK